MCQSCHLPSRWILPSPCPAHYGKRADLIQPAFPRSLCRCFSLDSLKVREGQAMRKGVKGQSQDFPLSLYLKGAGSCWLCLLCLRLPRKACGSSLLQGTPARWLWSLHLLALSILLSSRSFSLLSPISVLPSTPCLPILHKPFPATAGLVCFPGCIMTNTYRSVPSTWLWVAGSQNPTPCLCTLTFAWVRDKLLSSWNYVTWGLSWQIWQTRDVIFSFLTAPHSLNWTWAKVVKAQNPNH